MGETNETEAIHDGLGDVLARWTIGASPAATPTLWGAEIGEAAGEAELRLLALAGHFLAVSVGAAPPDGLRALPDIPALALPALPDAMRPPARRILANLKEANLRQSLLRLLVGRGWTMHPADWMPAAGDELVPDVYAPWRDWAETSASIEHIRDPAAGLDVETWSDHGPATRVAALAALRRRDPAAARALLIAKFSGEGAESRLRLLGLMAVGLSEADHAFLDGIVAADRAPKVEALAMSLLARLGHGQQGGEEATELAGFFEVVTKGMLRRTRIVEARVLTTAAQQLRRRQLFESVDLAGLASALNFASDEIVAAWRWRDDGAASVEFAEMLERSAPDPVIVDVFARIVGLEGSGDLGLAGINIVAALRSRLNVSQRTAFVGRMLRGEAPSFEAMLEIARGDCAIDDLMDGAAGSSLVEALTEDATRSDQVAELRALGLLASRDAARRAMGQFQTIGVLGADPSLDLIRFNAALPERPILPERQI